MPAKPRRLDRTVSTHLDVTPSRNGLALSMRLASDFHAGINPREGMARLHEAAAALLRAGAISAAFPYVESFGVLRIELSDGETMANVAARAVRALDLAGILACFHE